MMRSYSAPKKMLITFLDVQILSGQSWFGINGVGALSGRREMCFSF